MLTPPRVNLPNNPRDCGEIQLILGPMFAGKTTEMFRRIKRYTAANKHCVIIKYSSDTRYSLEHASSHDKEMLHAIPTSKLSDLNFEDLSQYDVIGIDEGQFYPDLVEFVDCMADQGKIVIISALDGDFRRKPFGRILELIPKAEKVTKLSAVCCLCYADAGFTKRLSNEKEVTVIGGSDKYIAVCRACYDSPVELFKSPSKLCGFNQAIERLESLKVLPKN
eukprot:TRINITY_DN1999_c0_g1_i2.p1 TRINITY_DN1999_c0_g1~~TRINITY_DN1999_c0_g1_i2.p1  ORF type:complete len:222 (+),score=50.48 TRINITY_DN1999_c0_g1_i2:61-726(+)